jgi:prepilin-type N-terminal cleavage/methylation domain-containing protein
VKNMHSKHSNFIHIRSQQAGFSLIELLVAMLISLTLIFACTALYSSLKSSISTAQNLAKAQESLRGSFYLMSRSLRQAKTFSFDGLSGAPNTELKVIYGTPPSGDEIYSCLGNTRDLDDEDIFFKKEDEDGLYCYDDGDVTKAGAQLIALGIEELHFIDSTGNNDDGVLVKMIIDGMPESMKTADGFSFTLALRQKILLDLAGE